MCTLGLVYINNFHNIVYLWVNFKIAYFFFRIFSHFYVGSMCHMRRLHLKLHTHTIYDNYNNDTKTLVQATAIDKT